MVNTTKKRKAEELEVSLDGDSNPKTDHKSDQLTNRSTDSDPVHPHLPAPVWGHVFDYMPNQEAHSALLFGKLIANEAAKYVTTLNIMRCCELYVRAARRFANVEEVNIFCLLKHESDDVQVLSADAASRTVPFISAFDVLIVPSRGLSIKISDKAPVSSDGRCPWKLRSRARRMLRDWLMRFAGSDVDVLSKLGVMSPAGLTAWKDCDACIRRFRTMDPWRLFSSSAASSSSDLSEGRASSVDWVVTIPFFFVSTMLGLLLSTFGLDFLSLSVSSGGDGKLSAFMVLFLFVILEIVY